MTWESAWEGAPARDFAAPRIDILLPILLLAGFVGAMLVLLGWQLDLPVLKAGIPGLGAAQPLTAAGLIVSLTGLWLAKFDRPDARRLVISIGIFMTTAAAIVVIQNALDVDWGTDRLLFADRLEIGQSGPFLRAGRPAGSALMGFAALAVCLLTARSQRPALIRLYLYSASLGLIGATIALIAYGLNIAPLFVIGLYVPASLPASLVFWLAFASALLIRSDQGPLATLLGNSIGAVSARSMLAWSSCLLFVLVVVVQISNHAHWYRAELLVLVSTLSGLAIMAIGIASHMKRIDAVEAHRQELLVQARALQLHAAKADEFAEAVSKDKKELVAALAHQLRNPLAAIAYSTEVLRQSAGQPVDTRDAIAALERQIARLKLVLEQSLDRYDPSMPSDQLNLPNS